MISDKDKSAYKALGMLTVLYRWGLLPKALQADARAIIVLADGEDAAAVIEAEAAIKRASA
jgi:hypothetical protein